MKTILELFNEGQRQFPMRGGGISPPLIGTFQLVQELNPPEVIGVLRPQNQSWNDNSENDEYANIWWDGRGVLQIGEFDNGQERALDLLPESLPNHTAELEAKDKRIAELEAALIDSTNLTLGIYASDMMGEKETTEIMAKTKGQGILAFIANLSEIARGVK